ncbi:MAG: P-II family nitrogen regulator [Planctomycetes bacterium]|nr:P-II family nitrogen regulator [Planctomycetota bacterium]
MPSVRPLSPEACARVIAIVRPFLLDEVIEALLPLGVHDVLIQQVRGYGRQKSHLEFYGHDDFQGGFLPKVRLEFVVDGARLSDVIAAVRKGAHTGRIGDGKIFVHALHAVRECDVAPAAAEDAR